MPDKSVNETNSAYLIRDAAIDFLERHSSQASSAASAAEGSTVASSTAAGAAAAPWFLYLPFQNIHGPYTTDVDTYVNQFIVPPPSNR